MVVYVGHNDVTFHSIGLCYSSCVLITKVTYITETELPKRHSMLVNLAGHFVPVFPIAHLAVSGHVRALA